MKRHRMHMDHGFPWRKAKRHERRTGYDSVYHAYIEGAYAADYRRQRPNPYPPGRRHDEWARGHAMGDIETALMGRIFL